MKKSIRYFKLLSASPIGLRSPLVTVEVVITPGIPRHHVVGLAQGAVKESLVRIRAAMLRTGYDFPRGAITVNLAPADTRKDSSAFDLPIALGILAADRRIDASCLESAPTLVLGELSLEGSVRPVSGVMPAMLRARESGLTRFLIPSANAPEASAFEGLQGACVSSLKEAVDQLKGHAWSSVKMTRVSAGLPPEKDCPPDFSVVIGQDAVIRSLAIAAAGRHNVLLSGSPGCGKTLMARCMRGILPPWSHETALAATCLHSLRRPGIHLLRERPFRSPHHSVSPAGLLGGGNPLRPGEVSLAHGGILFLDELPEFSPRALEGLREPMEECEVTLSRAREVESFPADFQLIAAMNPCPCGQHSQSSNDCRCSDRRRQAYRGRISGPLLDRIDIHIAVPRVDPTAVFEGERMASEAIRTRVRMASERMGTTPPHVDQNAERAMIRASASLRLSMRAVSSVRRIAQSISAYDQAEKVEKSHVAEAIRLGGQGRRFVAD